MSNDGNVYDKAREVLRERGWAQGTLCDFDGSVCLLGALSLALHPGITPRYSVGASPLPTWDTASMTIQEFNDRGTDADVDLVLDKAARAWDEQHAGGAA